MSKPRSAAKITGPMQTVAESGCCLVDEMLNVLERLYLGRIAY